MRIAFPYTFNDRDWLGGRNYYSGLFSAIEAVAGDAIELVLITGQKTLTTLPEQFPRLEVLRTSMLERRTFGSVLRRARRLPYGGSRDPHFAAFLRRHGIDLTSHHGGLGAGTGVRSLGWLPDFQFMQFPDYWTPRQLKDTRRSFRSACESCDALVVSSHDALGDLLAFAPECDLPKHVLHFVSLPVNVAQLRSLSDLQAQYQLPSRYIHLPNQFWAHKNHGVVVDALAALKLQGTEVTVACTGQTVDVRRPDHFGKLMERARDAGVSQNFRVLGLVPYSDMQALMLRACCVLNPSRFEGWSTTVEEAKVLGKRILLSDIPVHREQAPADGQYFSPDDALTLASLMKDAVAADASPIDAEEVDHRHKNALRVFGHAYIEIARQVCAA